MAESIHTFLNSFEGVREQPYGSGQYICKCPAHDDRKASLSIKDETASSGKILVHCQAGCSTDRVLAAAGKSFADIQPEKEKPREIPSWQRNLVAEYPYTDADGNYLYSKLRYEGQGIDDKEIRYARIIKGQYHAGKGNAPASMYNLTDLRKAIKTGRTVYYVEGEKDVETLRKYGLTAVTAGGTADWKSNFADHFIGASEVVIVADRDEPGQKLAQTISNDLRAVVYKHKVITPSGINHGDITDYLTSEGETIESLFNLINKTDPIPAQWTSIGKGRSSINVDLLAAEILKRNYLFVARNPGTKSDVLFWYCNGVYRQKADAEVAGIVRSWLPVGTASPDTINKVVRMIMYSAPVRQYDEINANERYINCKNGLVDIKNGTVIPHNADLISSLQLHAGFNADAEAPRWMEFVKDLCMDNETEQPDQQMIDVLQEWTGIILSSIYGYRIKKALILFSAEGNSGKSVYLTVVGKILGIDAVSNVDFKSLGSSRWATGRAFGRRALAVGDEGGERIESSAIFKQLTGGDVVAAEFKGLQAFDFVFRGVIVALCNVLPFFEDDRGNHVADRLMMLNCRHTIPETKRDPLLADKLMAERDGILQWAWIGLRRFLDNGYRFSRCKSSEDLMRDYRARYDTMYAFLQDEMEVTGDKHDTIKRSDLEFMYNAYCQARELTPLGKKNIKLRLASLGIPEGTLVGYSVYRGVRKKSFSEIDPSEYTPF